MYYLPEYLVFNAERVTKNGMVREFFGGINRKTIRSKTIDIPTGIKTFASPLMIDINEINYDKADIRIDVLSNDIYVASGALTNVLRIFPKLPLRFVTQNADQPLKYRNIFIGMLKWT